MGGPEAQSGISVEGMLYNFTKWSMLQSHREKEMCVNFLGDERMLQLFVLFLFSVFCINGCHYNKQFLLKFTGGWWSLVPVCVFSWRSEVTPLFCLVLNQGLTDFASH